MNNRNTEPLIITFSVLLILTLLSWHPIKVGVFKNLDFLADIRKVDTASIATLVKSEVKKVNVLDTLLKKENIKPELSIGLNLFFKALQQEVGKKSNNVRIAYFGDSMIEGDLVTNDLRKMFQKIFGGSGVGFVPITSITAGFRISIRHNFNNKWGIYNYSNAKAPRGLYYGPSGFLFIPNDGAKVSFSSTREYAPFKSVRLYLGKAKLFKLLIETDSITMPMELHASSLVNEVTLHEGTPINRISLEVTQADSSSIYGCSFENGKGIYIDNYSFRGNSGIPLSSVSSSVYKGFSEKMNYKLIILHYGLNVVGHNVKNYTWYEQSFGKTIEYIKESFPNASILLISMSDKSYFQNGEWVTEPDVPIFVDMQQKLAKSHGIAFWNLYEAMGGYNSMKSWVENKPRLANMDYTHPNFRGASKVASLLFEYLMNNYKYFQTDSLLYFENNAKDTSNLMTSDTLDLSSENKKYTNEFASQIKDSIITGNEYKNAVVKRLPDGSNFLICAVNKDIDAIPMRAI